MRTYIKIAGKEREVVSATVYPAGCISMTSPGHVRIVTEMEYAEAKALFSDPGEWSVIERPAAIKYADGTAIQPEDIVTDCTGYDVLRSITDTMAGTLEIVVSEITDSEALAVLMGDKE